MRRFCSRLEPSQATFQQRQCFDMIVDGTEVKLPLKSYLE